MPNKECCFVMCQAMMVHNFTIETRRQGTWYGGVACSEGDGWTKQHTDESPHNHCPALVFCSGFGKTWWNKVKNKTNAPPLPLNFLLSLCNCIEVESHKTSEKASDSSVRMKGKTDRAIYCGKCFSLSTRDGEICLAICSALIDRNADFISKSMVFPCAKRL